MPWLWILHLTDKHLPTLVVATFATHTLYPYANYSLYFLYNLLPQLLFHVIYIFLEILFSLVCNAIVIFNIKGYLGFIFTNVMQISLFFVSSKLCILRLQIYEYTYLMAVLIIFIACSISIKLAESRQKASLRRHWLSGAIRAKGHVKLQFISWYLLQFYWWIN